MPRLVMPTLAPEGGVPKTLTKARRKRPRKRGVTSWQDVMALPDDHPSIGPEADWTGVEALTTEAQYARLRRLAEACPIRPWYVCAYDDRAAYNVLSRAFGATWCRAKDIRRPTLQLAGMWWGCVQSAEDMVGTPRGTVLFLPDPVWQGREPPDFASVRAYVRDRNAGLTLVQHRWTKYHRRGRDKVFDTLELREWLRDNWNG